MLSSTNISLLSKQSFVFFPLLLLNLLNLLVALCVTC